MMRHLVADGGDGLQIWSVVTKILNKQSRRADKGWLSSLWVGREANNFSLYEDHFAMKCYTASWIWTDSLELFRIWI